MAQGPRSLSVGLVLLAGALVLCLISLVVTDVWASLSPPLPRSTGVEPALRAFWMPLTGLLLDVGTAGLGAFGFGLVWRGRGELGAEYASRSGLGPLAVLLAAAEDALYTLTGALLGYVAGVALLAPWHRLVAVVGAVAVGLALYWFLATLPVSGARPVAVVALALGIAGIALVNLVTFTPLRGQSAELGGAGLGLSVASAVLWLALCLWGREMLGAGGRGTPARAAMQDV